MNDLLDQLRDENPVDAADLLVPDRLLVRPRRALPSGRWLVPSVALMAAIVLAVLLVPGRPQPTLAERAAAATTGGISHWKATAAHGHLQIEGWSDGNVIHTIDTLHIGGKVTMAADTRVVDGRGRQWTRREQRIEPIEFSRGAMQDPNGLAVDPFAIFRAAYHAGWLRKVGSNRYEIRSVNTGKRQGVFVVDPATALPRRLIVNGSVSLELTEFERLPFSERAKLQLLDRHPKAEPVAVENYFAVLRSGSAPPAAIRARLRPKADRVDLMRARLVGDGAYLIPGESRVCLLVLRPHGVTGGCLQSEQILRTGFGVAVAHQGQWNVFADARKTARVRDADGHETTVAIKDNYLRIEPGQHLLPPK